MRSFFLALLPLSLTSLSAFAYCPAGAEYDQKRQVCTSDGFAVPPFLDPQIEGCKTRALTPDLCTADKVSLDLFPVIQTELQCPPESIYDDKAKLCIRGDKAIGPFTEEMIQFCINDGLGREVCEGKEYPKNKAEFYRKDGDCPRDTARDPATGNYCRDQAHAYGPFRPKDFATCANNVKSIDCLEYRMPVEVWDVDSKIPWHHGENDPFGVSYKGAKWPKAWTTHAKNSLEIHAPELIRAENIKGLEEICPNYSLGSMAQKTDALALFLASIAYPESAYKPDTVYNEPAPLNKPSIGLFQLSKDDGAHGKVCDFNRNGRDIKDPFANIECAAKILSNQVKKKGTLFPKKAYYWSVLSNQKQKIVKDVFNDNDYAVIFCKFIRFD